MTFSSQIMVYAALLIPACYGLAGLLTYFKKAYRWHYGEWATLLAPVLTVLLIVCALLMEATATGILWVNTITLILLSLVTLIGWVILRFSRHYLAGDGRQDYFQRWFLLTLSAISLLVISNHIVLFMIAWVAVSLSLHQLLIYYPDRPKALLAAHKKFIISRLADALLFFSLLLMAVYSDRLLISEIVSVWASSDALPWVMEWAMVLMVIAAIVKCAQLPFHGWLLQVMEAPTPVSALLHAGIINIGGILLLRFADLFSLTLFAHWLLLVAGTVTAVVASLTLMTRISIKVMLAWSTCAQMGFMLIEIALGFYELALLHLVAHSCYKAYSFLNSGDAVQRQIHHEAYGSHISGHWSHWLIALLLVAGLGMVVWSLMPVTPGVLVLMTIVGVGLVIFMTESLRYPLQRLHLLVVGGVITIAALYLLNHFLFTQLSANSFSDRETGVYEAGVVIASFTLFLVVFSLLRLWPNSAFSRWLYPYLYAGLYLDEWLSRGLLRYWPCQTAKTTYSVNNISVLSQSESNQ